MLEERERACDEAVLESGHDGGEYAAGILAVCRHCRAQRGGGLRRQPPAISRGACDTSWAMRVRLRSAHSRRCPARVPLSRPRRCRCSPAPSTAPRDGSSCCAAIRAPWAARTFSVELGEQRPSNPRHIVAARDGVLIRNSPLRDLVALSYGVERWQVSGDGQWLDTPRYDIRAVAHDPVNEPEELDPHALRELTPNYSPRVSTWRFTSTVVARRLAGATR